MTSLLSTKKLDKKKALTLISENGPLSLGLKGFESRREQEMMMANVIDAYNEKRVALIEAGTGTGKSIAYLLPAMLFALQMKEKTLISTHTINLQEQLLHKDIPLLKKALGIELKAVILKGMGNYLCLRKLHENDSESDLFPEEESEEFDRIEAWSHSTYDGTKSDLPFMPKAAVWEKVSAESDTCTRERCPHYSSCHFFKARKAAEDAQILISNHSLLFVDLAFRAESENGVGILPDYQRIVLDEAHNIEDIATDHLAKRVSAFQLMKTLGRLASDKLGKSYGKLPQLKNKLISRYPDEKPREIERLLQTIDCTLPAIRKRLQEHAIATFDLYAQFMAKTLQHSPKEGGGLPGESKLRIREKHHQDALWVEGILPKTEELRAAIEELVNEIGTVEYALKNNEDDSLEQETSGIRHEIQALAARLETYAKVLKQFMQEEIPSDRVRWIESHNYRQQQGITLIEAALEISTTLAEQLFSNFESVVLCSATLAANQEFHFIRKRLGLTKDLLPYKEISENLYASPFNYKEQSLLVVPTDLPLPNAPHFIREAAERIWTAIQASRGNAFILFTSYSMMRQCYDLLEERLNNARYPAMKQGDYSRRILLKNFAETERSVLFGTDSFWEGVDVVGEALRCVVIVKLPFQVPSEPIVEARVEAILENGGKPFMDYSVPNAIVKFKQGFGRLIRKRKDRGCIVCLDTRLINKAYGKLFLNSLPDCQKVFSDTASIQSVMQDFYKKTYHLTKD